MPIIHVHGVGTRDPKTSFAEIRQYLRRFVAPVISATPDEVLIDQAYWGDAGAHFAWQGASRPKSLLLGQGAEGVAASAADRALLAAALRASLGGLPATPTAERSSGLVSGHGRPAAGAGGPALRLKDLSADELSDLLADLIALAVSNAELRGKATLVADALARDPSLAAALAAAPDSAAECDLLIARLRAELPSAGLVGMGSVGDWFRDVGDRLGEAASRAVGMPGAAASAVAGEFRKGLNEFVSLFIGDVFAYLNGRFDKDDKTRPGPIPRRFLDKLEQARDNRAQRGDEPIVVLSHSMGGQIVYDALTHFVPRDPLFAGLRVDFWCATASQVGFFEEAKLFVASRDAYGPGNPVPFPSQHLRAWWNVWDYNDFISFTVKDIIAGVDDGPYRSGMSLIGAHSGYLQRPSFYRQLAERIRSASP
jgi:hypothetical protein